MLWVRIGSFTASGRQAKRKVALTQTVEWSSTRTELGQQSVGAQGEYCTTEGAR